MRRNEPKMASMTDTASSFPVGRNCSAAMTGDGSVRGVDNRIGRHTAGVPLTGFRERSRRIVGPCSSVAGGARGVKCFGKALAKIATKSGPLQFAQRLMALPADGVGNESRNMISEEASLTMHLEKAPVFWLEEHSLVDLKVHRTAPPRDAPCDSLAVRRQHDLPRDIAH